MGFTPCCSLASHSLLPPIPIHSTRKGSSTSLCPFPFPAAPRQQPTPLLFSHSLRIAASASKNPGPSESESKEKQKVKEQEEVEVEEDLPWIQEKALDLVEFTGSVTQAIPGPRVGPTSLPWILAVPLAYAGLTFVIAFIKTLKKFTSPKAKRRRLVGKNAMLCKSLDELFQKGRDQVNLDILKDLENKTGFDLEGILCKYIRYALNEKPFNPDMVADLIQLRRASMLNDTQVAETLNEILRRIVQDKAA